MKRLFTLLRVFSLLIFLGGLTQTALAQGNLKFSQVRYVTLSGDGLYNGPTNVQTVDTKTLVVAPNHVLKIESINGIFTQISSQGSFSVLIDNAVLAKENGNATSLQTRPFPIWLPQGTYNVELYYYNSVACTGMFCTPVPYPGKAGLSAIDFEIIP